MCKRAISLWLALALLLTIACPAFGEEELVPQSDAAVQEFAEIEEELLPVAEEAFEEVSEEVSIEEEAEAPVEAENDEAEIPAETEPPVVDEFLVEEEAPVEEELVEDAVEAEALPVEEEANSSKDAAPAEAMPSPRIKSVEAAAEGVCIRWEAVEGAAKYRVMYRLSASGEWKKLADTAETSYSWKKAKDNKDYLFTLRCLDASGAVMAADYDEAGVAFRRLKAPSLSQQEPTPEGVRLSWNKVAGAQKYLVEIERDGAWQPLGAVEDTSYLYTDVKSGNSYRFRVCCAAADGSAPVSAWSANSKAALWLTAPEVARVEAAQKGIEIEWSEVPGAEKYRVYSRTGSGSWKKVADVAGTSYAWKNAKANTAYGFAVCCVDKKGKVCTSGRGEAAQSFTLLATPKLSGAVLAGGGVRVSWKAVSGAERYAVLCKSGSEAWREIGFTEAGATEFLWAEAESGISYKFAVRCVSADGALPTSGYDAAGASVKYLAAPAVRATCASDGVNIRWDEVPGAVKYRLLYKEAGADQWKKLKDVTEPSLLWTGAQSGVHYAFTVACVDKKGKKYVSAYDEQGVELTFIAVPKLTSVLSVDGGVRVEWEAVPGVSKYQILRKVDGGEWTSVATSTETNYTWTGEGGGAFSVGCLAEDGVTPVGGFDVDGASPVNGKPELIGVEWSGNNIVVKWNPVSGAVNYCVLYKSGNDWKIAGSTSGTSFTWKKAKSGKAYVVTVACASASGTAVTSEFDTEGKALLVPMKKLARYSYFRNYMTDAQMKKVYKIAVKVVEPLVGMDKKDQLIFLAIRLRQWFDLTMKYSTTAAHYNDPYGYFINKAASCAGCTRTTGFCLNLLGINYEHINENQWKHQWVRVKVGDEYWISDAYVYYYGPEPGKRKHPYYTDPNFNGFDFWDPLGPDYYRNPEKYDQWVYDIIGR